jgi:hypothetical protein
MKGESKWITQRKWQHRVHKTRKNKQKHNSICAWKKGDNTDTLNLLQNVLLGYCF